MKKILYLLFLFVIFFFGFKIMSLKVHEKSDINNLPVDVSTNEGSINIAYFDVEPHVFLDKETGQIKGALYEFIENEMSPEMKVKFIWDKQATTIPRQLEILKKEKSYAVALLTKTPDRDAIYAFTEKPFFDSKSAIALRKDNQLQKISSVDNVIGLKVGYADKTYISSFMQDKRVTFDLISNPNYHEINLAKLLGNRIDAVYAPDKASLLALSKRMNINRQVKILDLPENPVPFYIVFSKNLSDIAEKYNKAFDKLNGQNLYIKLLKKYLDISKL